jgi:MarR family 2-MHQ and catechol resistance regulon transcriptional repressor
MGTRYAGTNEEIRALDCYIKLSRAAESVGQRINSHLRQYDLTVSQFGALEALFHLGPMPSGELGEKILKSSGNMTLVLDNLAQRGLVVRKRRKSDRRCVDIFLTEAGKDLVAGMFPDHVARVVAAFQTLTAEEQEQLAQLCRTVGVAEP